jgi:hypothetical protein
LQRAAARLPTTMIRRSARIRHPHRYGLVAEKHGPTAQPDVLMLDGLPFTIKPRVRT